MSGNDSHSITFEEYIKAYQIKYKDTIFKQTLKNYFKTDECLTENVKYEIEDDVTKKDYQIAICHDGKFAVTFDTGKNMYIFRH